MHCLEFVNWTNSTDAMQWCACNSAVKPFRLKTRCFLCDSSHVPRTFMTSCRQAFQVFGLAFLLMQTKLSYSICILLSGMANIMQARDTNGQAVEMKLTCCISSVALLIHSQNWQGLSDW